MDFKMPERQENSHKGTFGRVLNIAGSDYMPGAALLSSLSALKIGCGYVFLVSTERVIDAVAAQTQNIVFAPIADIDNQLENADVLLIGCGLSTSKNAQDSVCDCILPLRLFPLRIPYRLSTSTSIRRVSTFCSIRLL